MIDREEYLQKLKAKLDEWDADLDALEVKAREAQADAEAQYRKQVESLRAMRDDAFKQYAQMQDAAADVWETMAAAGEKTWQTWLDAFDQVRGKGKGGPTV